MKANIVDGALIIYVENSLEAYAMESWLRQTHARKVQITLRELTDFMESDATNFRLWLKAKARAEVAALSTTTQSGDAGEK